ncbi:MAG TPA: chorismate synthase [Syntrophales bacterium]|nr:chorismate synthase [Syntrophales bacterium]
MSGSSIGVLFKVTTWGESHGPAIGAIVEGCPSGIDLIAEDIQKALDRRRPGRIASSSPRKEEDAVKILSGTFQGKTTGTPISLIIENRDVNSSAYEDIKDIFRPGQGDYTYFKKYGIRDYRGGGRASGRETAARVAAGAIAGKIISKEGMEVIAYTKALGGIAIKLKGDAAKKISHKNIAGSTLMCPDPDAAKEMEAKLEKARRSGDSLGGIVEIIVRGCPPGLGEPVFDKMDADLAGALMGIGTVKGVEIGAGFKVAEMTGSQANDPITPEGFLSNHAGGILAGITTGQDIVIRVACKPISSIAKVQQTIDVQGKPVELSIKGRHDVSVIPRIITVCEAMVSIILADHLLRQKATAHE